MESERVRERERVNGWRYDVQCCAESDLRFALLLQELLDGEVAILLEHVLCQYGHIRTLP